MIDEQRLLTSLLRVRDDLDAVIRVLSDNAATATERTSAPATTPTPAVAASSSSRGGGGDTIAALRENDESIDLIATLSRVWPMKAYEKRGGGTGQVQNIEVSDRTGTMKVILWGEQCKMMNGLKEGDLVHVRAWKVGRDKRGELQIVLGRFGSVAAADPAQERLL